MKTIEDESTEKELACNFGKIILASQSPRRKELLQSLTKSFEVIPSEVNEKINLALPAEENALAIAREKACYVASRHKGKIIIGADTIVFLDGKIIGKPKDENDAYNILRILSGRQHQVITGVAVVDSSGNVLEEVEVSTVRIKHLTEEEIISYVSTSEPLDKAGAYAIQGKGAFMIDSYEGSYSNIVGLPLGILKKCLLKAAGLVDAD